MQIRCCELVNFLEVLQHVVDRLVGLHEERLVAEEEGWCPGYASSVVQVHAMTLDVDQIVEVLRSLEQLLGVRVNVFISDTEVHNHVYAFVAIELHYFVRIYSSLRYIHLVHDVQHRCHAGGLKSLHIHLVQRIGSHEDAAISDLLEEKLVEEIAVSFVHPAVNDENLVGLAMEASLIGA